MDALTHCIEAYLAKDYQGFRRRMHRVTLAGYRPQ